MNLLFECGSCSNLCQVQDEKISNALQKSICPSCKAFYYFSRWDPKVEASKPAIEKVNTLVGKIPSVQSQEFIPAGKEIFWKCGICDSNYHFDVNRITANGIKVTCTMCLQFFVLQKIENMVDLDALITQDVSEKILLQKPAAKNSKDFLDTLDEKEVSGRFDITALKPSSDSPKIPGPANVSASKTAEIAPDVLKKKDTSVAKTVEIPPTILEKSDLGIMKTVELPASISEKRSSAESKTIEIPSSVLLRKDALVKGDPLSPPEITLPDRKTRKGPKTFFHEQTTGSEEKKNTIQLEPVDENFINSFKAFHVAKKKFKIDQANVVVSAPFVEQTDFTKKNTLEKNMVKISLWVIGLTSISFAALTAYEHLKPKKVEQDNQPVTTPVETSPYKPKYGFPELGE